MKKIYLVLLILSLVFFKSNTFAQFNLPKKKSAVNKTIADKEVLSPSTKQDDPPAQFNSIKNPISVADSNIKPAKVVDTMVVGGFNSSNKKSLRNNYAFSSETKKRSSLKDRFPLPYENLREEDALFSEFLWEDIDAREKQNRPFIYQSYDQDADQRFFALLMRAIEKEGVTAFSPEDDRFTTPISLDEINTNLKGSLDTQLVQNVDNPNIYDTTVFYNTKLAPQPDSIYTFRLKEQFIFDGKTSRMYCRIIGIMPIATIKVNDKIMKRPLFWLYYPDLRPTLAKTEIYNPRNFSNRITWEELFESRYFSSTVYKTTLDNYNDKPLNALFKDPMKRLLEGEKIKQKIFNYEQERWVY
jgi:gliding motility associated protien GldN